MSKEFNDLCEAFNFEQKLLLIDDDLDFCNLFTRFLKQSGFVTEIALDGVEGLAKVIAQKKTCPEIEKPYRAIFLDLRLPRVAGEDVLVLIKQIMPLVPIVILSGCVQMDVKERALQKGALTLMDKPTTLDEQSVHDILVQLNLK